MFLKIKQRKMRPENNLLANNDKQVNLEELRDIDNRGS